MALIKTDPSQTKTVVALVSVLVVAVGVTVVRLKPQAPTKAAALTQQGQASRAPVRVSSEPAAYRRRNPFEKPADLPAAPAVDGDAPQGGLSGPSRDPLPEREAWTPGGWATIEPADPGSILAVKPAPKPGPAKPDLAGPRPVFTLLATVNSDRGFSAVIRAGESEVRVADVGDTLQGGFKVIDLNGDRAVLTDGRETVVAKRPQ